MAAAATTSCSLGAAAAAAAGAALPSSSLKASGGPSSSARPLPSSRSGCCRSSSFASSSSSARNGISGGHAALTFSSEAAERRGRRWNNHHGNCSSGSIRAATVAAVAADAPPSSSSISMPRLKKVYIEKVVPALKEEFKYQSPQEIPYLQKIVVNCGVGEAAQNAKSLESTVRDLAIVTGQKPVTTRAKKAIAGFKLREGVPVGVCLTLRGEVMFSFLDRLVNLALPRTRDFQGVNPYSFDGKGNYTLGVPEQSVFPEIRFENIDRQRGMDVNIVSSAKNDTEGLKLLTLLGMPFKEGTSVRSASSGKKRAKDMFMGRKRMKVPKRKN